MKTKSKKTGPSRYTFCLAVHTLGYVCTREKGHTGIHKAESASVPKFTYKTWKHRSKTTKRKMKNMIVTVLSLALSLFGALAQDPCPDGDCGTNEMPPYVYAPEVHPPGSMAVRVASISANGVVMVTNRGFIDTTNGFTDSPMIRLTDDNFAAPWDFLLAVRGTYPTNEYIAEMVSGLPGTFTQGTVRGQGTGGADKILPLTIANPFTAVGSYFRGREYTVNPYCPVTTNNGPGCEMTTRVGFAVAQLSGGDFGWQVDTNSLSVPTCYDGTGRTDTRVQYLGNLGSIGCSGGGQVSITNFLLHPGEKYKFTIFFPSGIPAAPYPMRLVGFKQP